MWLSQRVVGQKSSAGSEMASVTSANNGAVSASAYSGEYRDVPAFSGFGYMANPTENASALILPFEDAGACVGFLPTESPTLLPGEILIKSPSGAFIKLCANGTVSINGTVFEQKK